MTRLLNLARVVAWHLGAYEHQRAGHLLVGTAPASIQYFESSPVHKQSRARGAQTPGPVTQEELAHGHYTF